jgi:hypothetical protein
LHLSPLFPVLAPAIHELCHQDTFAYTLVSSSLSLTYSTASVERFFQIPSRGKRPCLRLDASRYKGALETYTLEFCWTNKNKKGVSKNNNWYFIGQKLSRIIQKILYSQLLKTIINNYDKKEGASIVLTHPLPNTYKL